MTPKFRHRTLACAGGVLAAGCTLAGMGASQANAVTEKPGVVNGFAVKNGGVTADGATFTWDKDAGATSYRVVIVNASTPMAPASYSSGYTLSGTSVTVSTLAAGTAYGAKISAEDAAGASEWSQWVLFYTAAAQGPPGAKGARGAKGAPGAKGTPGVRGPSGIVSTKTYSLVADATGDSESIPTGGSFGSHAKKIGTVALTAGTYLLNVNFIATPNATTAGDVFPQAFAYDGTPAANFSNDLFNVGSGALAHPYNASDPGDNVNSYYSGTSVITVPSGGETLDVYAFGYDSDQGAGSYELNSATLTATALDAARR